jgi:hypothetical protein
MPDQDNPVCSICKSERYLNHYLIYAENDWRLYCGFCWDSIHDGMYDHDQPSE